MGVSGTSAGAFVGRFVGLADVGMWWDYRLTCRARVMVHSLEEFVGWLVLTGGKVSGIVCYLVDWVDVLVTSDGISVGGAVARLLVVPGWRNHRLAGTSWLRFLLVCLRLHIQSSIRLRRHV
jgi:hypothetical protein